MKDLHQLRQIIDLTDETLLQTLAQRMSTAEQIGELKASKNKDVTDSERDEDLRKNWQEKGKKLGLNTDFVNKILDLILKESKQIQNQNK